jgi:hypothetical protein
VVAYPAAILGKAVVDKVLWKAGRRLDKLILMSQGDEHKLRCLETLELLGDRLAERTDAIEDDMQRANCIVEDEIGLQEEMEYGYGDDGDENDATDLTVQEKAKGKQKEIP